MKKILLIDDLRNFRNPETNTEVVIARNEAEALAALDENNVWDEVWFDHDLGEATGRIESVMGIVDYFCEKAFNGIPVEVPLIYVHTSNPVGIQNIVTSLERYGYTTRRVYAATIFIVEDIGAENE